MANVTSEQEVQRLARALYHQAARQKPALFDAQDLLGRMIDWSLDDESLRVALFRFVDVLPSLESSAEIGRHLEEYFSRADHALLAPPSAAPLDSVPVHRSAISFKAGR